MVDGCHGGGCHADGCHWRSWWMDATVVGWWSWCWGATVVEIMVVDATVVIMMIDAMDWTRG